MNIVENIKKEILNLSKKYKLEAEDNYDFWNEHIKYVYEESKKLATEYNADLEIVELGALLHDVALITKIGDRKDHHINGEKIASEMLEKYNYPEEKKKKVLSCVYNHRSSKNAKNIEDICVADADILAHFDNIPMLFNSAFHRNNVKLENIRDYMRKFFKEDFNDLSDRTKETFRSKYDIICKIILND